MNRLRIRFLTLLAILPIVVVLSALLYRLGMVQIEGEERDFWSALEFASETITTVGYGADADWKHPVMVLYVIGLVVEFGPGFRFAEDDLVYACGTNAATRRFLSEYG